MQTLRIRLRLQKLNNDYDFILDKARHCHIRGLYSGYIGEIEVLRQKIEKYCEILGE